MVVAGEPKQMITHGQGLKVNKMATEIKEPEVIVPAITPIHTPGISIANKISNAFAKYWSVVVWNDDVHTYEYVIISLMAVVGCTEEEGLKFADTIHHEGKCIVASETQEKAELYQAQLIELELTATIERNS